MLEVILMNAKTCMVVLEVVSQHLDQYKNNGLSKLSCMIFSKSWFYAM